MTSKKKGSIHCEEAYALGKMLDCGGWYGRLPRGITPSDIDLVFDNRGWLILVEFSSQTPRWIDIPKGQAMMYSASVFNACARHVAALCFHQVEGRQINTVGDVLAFSLMYYRLKKTKADTKAYVATTDAFRGCLWPGFVDMWFKPPAGLLGWMNSRTESDLCGGVH